MNLSVVKIAVLVLGVIVAGILPTGGAVAADCGNQFDERNAPDRSTCKFTCQTGDLLTIGISASDGDASVSGSARCGGGYSPCVTTEGRNNCRGEEGSAARSDRDGDCTAVVDELWNSAWSYACSANALCPPTEAGCKPDPRDRCPVARLCCPRALCEDFAVPSCPTLEIRAPDAGVKFPDVCATSGGTVVERSRVTVTGVGAIASAQLCVYGTGCRSIPVYCVVDAGRLACSTSSEPNVLAIAPRP